MILEIIEWLTALLLKSHDSDIQSIYNNFDWQFYYDSDIQSIYNNFDLQFYYAIANPQPLAGSASKYLRSLQAFAAGSPWVRSGFALCPP
jgi:hypothetical protein